MRSMSVRSCGDPECSGQAEPEQDGEHCSYWACPECGFEFGYELMSPDSDEGACQIGVPENIRRAASAPAQRVFDEQTRGLPVVQIQRRPPG